MHLKDYCGSIGPTPLLPLHSISKNPSLPHIYAKCEFLNPAGSVGHRRALQIFSTLQAKQHEYTPQCTILHSLGLPGSAQAAETGHPSICIGNGIKTDEYSRLFTAHRSFLVQSESQVHAQEMKQTLHSAIPNSVIADELQSDCKEVPSIIEAIQAVLPTGTHVDMIVCTSASLDILMSNPAELIDILIIVGDTIEADPAVAKKYPAAGWYQISEEDAQEKTSELISKEGLFCSQKGGIVLCAALAAISDNQLGQDTNVILILEEVHSLSTAFPKPKKLKSSDNPLDGWWKEQLIGDIPLKPVPILDSRVSIGKAMQVLSDLSSERAAIQCSEAGRIDGTVSLSHLRSKLTSGLLCLTDSLEADKAIFRTFQKVTCATTLGDVMEPTVNECFALVVVQNVIELEGKTGHDEKHTHCCQSNGRDIVLAVITKFDVLQYIAKVEEHHLNKPPFWNIAGAESSASVLFFLSMTWWTLDPVLQGNKHFILQTEIRCGSPKLRELFTLIHSSLRSLPLLKFKWKAFLCKLLPNIPNAYQSKVQISMEIKSLGKQCLPVASLIIHTAFTDKYYLQFYSCISKAPLSDCS